MLGKGSMRKIWIICSDKGRAQCLLRFIGNQYFSTLESWHIPAHSSMFQRSAEEWLHSIIMRYSPSVQVFQHDPSWPICTHSYFQYKRNRKESSLKKYFLSLNNLMTFHIMAISNHAFGDPESVQLSHLLLDLCLSSNSSLLIFVRISGLDNSSFIWFSLDNRACVSLRKASFTKSASWLFPRGKEQYNMFYSN